MTAYLRVKIVVLICLITCPLLGPNQGLAAPSESELKEYIKEHSTNRVPDAPEPIDQGDAYKTNREIAGNNAETWSKIPVFHPMWRLGNRSEKMADDYRNARSDDNKDFSTLVCNSSDVPYSYFHTYRDLQTRPKVERSGNCAMKVNYDPVDTGIQSGYCEMEVPIANCQEVASYCGMWAAVCYAACLIADGLICDAASDAIHGPAVNIMPYCSSAIMNNCWGFRVQTDLVEYEYPTKTANFSNQWGQSRLMKRKQLAGNNQFAEMTTPPCQDPGNSNSASPLCKLYWHLDRARRWKRNNPNNSGKRKVWEVMDAFAKSPAVKNAYKGKKTPPIPTNITPLNYPWIQEFVFSQPIFGLLWNPTDGSPIPTNQFLAWLQYGSGERTLARFFRENQAYRDARKATGMPHDRIREPDYFSDIRDFQLSYWLPDSRTIRAGIYNAHRRDPGACVRNNLYTGKTDPKLGQSLGWAAQDTSGDPWDFDNMRCIDDVGEIGPYAAAIRRPVNTDGAFQSIAKWLQVYDRRNIHTTFRPDADHLFFPYLHPKTPLAIEPIFNRKIVEDNVSGTVGGCGRYDAFAQENWKFQKANSYQFDGASGVANAVFPEEGEGTAEIMTRFKGCWGLRDFEGTDSWFLTLIVSGPTRFYRDHWQELRIR